MGYYLTVDQKGTKIYVEDIGSGMPILFLHGWPVNHKMFEYQFNELPKHEIRCIAIDLRGFGKSSRPFKGYTYNSLADDVRAVIHALQLSALTLVGFSMGGAIALRYMSRHLGFGVNKLILAGAAVPSFIKRDDFPYGLSKGEVDSIIQATYQDRPAMLADFGQKFFNSKISSSFRDWFQLLGLEASGHGTIKTAKSLRDEDLREDLSQIFVKAYILHGKKDQICPFPLAEAMHKGIEGSTLIPFEKSGHGLFYDEQKKFTETLKDIVYSAAKRD
ncbi:alpha/beta hydrolase [Priestia flexa]|uniref:alpha/beta fold hydrolase n=1 Tax=Priestia flexa TaxID=86664 RepID=UPI0020402A0A|nr:alpha/beta hydrolase [Priestia flexa]MCM3067953.1 alpha/beta hydrolase [Priestia flexa]